MAITAPDALALELDPTAAGELPPAADDGVTPSAAETDPTPQAPAVPAKPVLSKEERDQRAQAGRDAKAARMETQALKEHIAALTSQVSTLVNGMSAQAQANREAYIDSLAPTDQVAFLKQELAAARQPQPAPRPQAQPQTQEEVYQAAREYLAEINDELGLKGTRLEVVGNEPAITTKMGPDGWYASVKALAHARAEQLEGEGSVPAKKEEAPADIAALVAREVQKITGVGRSLSANPASGGNADITPKQIKELAATGSARLGFKDMRATAQKNLDAFVKKHPVEELAARAREQSNY